jgi:hypothetical protein
MVMKMSWEVQLSALINMLQFGIDWLQKPNDIGSGM